MSSRSHRQEVVNHNQFLNQGVDEEEMEIDVDSDEVLKAHDDGILQPRLDVGVDHHEIVI